MMTIAATLEAAAQSGRGIRALEQDGRTVLLPYGTVLAESLSIAAALRARGHATGDRVALIVPDVSDFVLAFFGISVAGLVPVPLCPPSLTADAASFTDQTAALLRASRAAAVVTTGDVAGVFDIGDRARAVMLQDLRGGPPLPRPVPVDAERGALVQFTSGSTAAPKGVVLTHANIHANIAAISGPAGLNVGSRDVGVSWLPLYHDMGLIGMLLTAVHTANDIILMSPLVFLKRPTSWLDAISTYRATVSFAPAFAYELCVRRVKPSQVDALDLSCWRVAGCGAEPIRPDVLRAFADTFAPAGFRASAFVASYGLAEHSRAVSFEQGGLAVDKIAADLLVVEGVAEPATDQSVARVEIVSCGRAFPGHDIRIVDEQGRPLADRHVGSIVARGPSVMCGYFEDAAATAEAMKDGWLHTGDLGYLVDGRLFVCGRTKDLIVRHGRKYHPADLEAATAALPGLRSGGVAAFAVSRLGDADEVVVVVEARAAHADGIPDEVRRRIRETAGLDVDRVVVAPPGTIPRTTSGKVRRAETRARFESGNLT